MVTSSSGFNGDIIITSQIALCAISGRAREGRGGQGGGGGGGDICPRVQGLRGNQNRLCTDSCKRAHGHLTHLES